MLQIPSRTFRVGSSRANLKSLQSARVQQLSKSIMQNLVELRSLTSQATMNNRQRFDNKKIPKTLYVCQK